MGQKARCDVVDLPPINSLLEVTVPPASAYRSRVEDRDGDLLAIATPIGAGDVIIPDDGQVLELAWIAARGRYVVPARLLGRSRERLPRWQVLALGQPALRSRRRYVRGGGGEPITIQTLERDPAGSWSGRVVDVSEGGVRCRVPDTDLAVDEPVMIHIELPAITVELAGTVLALREPGEPGGTGVDVVVVYQAPEATAHHIRRHVFAWERAERQRFGRAERRLVTPPTRHPRSRLWARL